jgi:uncharacterized membrane protein YhaH (DUF805 family)
MESRLKKHLDKLHSFDNERKGWLALSGFVVTAVIGIIFSWKTVIDYHLLWVIISGGFTLLVIWWYWTMVIVRHMIESKTSEYIILHEIIESIKEIKEDVKNLD